jgi:iron complex outermembrane recepter protein
LSYHLSTAIGRITPTVAVTEGYKYTVTLRPGQPVQNNLGQASLSPGYMPRWKGNVGVNWDRSAWSFGVMGRYVGSYQDYVDFSPAGGHELGSIWVFDTNLRYRFGAALGESSRFKDAYVTAGGVNILNRQPPFSYYLTGYDVQQADLRGRFLYIQLGVRL